MPAAQIKRSCPGFQIRSPFESSRAAFALPRIGGTAPPADHTSLASHRDLAQPAVAYVVDEAAHRNFLWNPRMRAQLLQLVAHVLLDVLERIEECRGYRCGAGAVLDTPAQVLFL